MKTLDKKSTGRTSHMKGNDFLHIAFAGWMQIAAIPLIFFTFSFYLFLSAGTAHYELQLEKTQPCELIVTAEEFTAASTGQAAEIDSVLQTTLVYAVPATLTVDQFCITTTLYGISADYLDAEADMGMLFPENTGMPYLFLNQKALEELMATGKDTKNPFSGNDNYEDMISEKENDNNSSSSSNNDSAIRRAILSYDWLNASVTVAVSENQSVVSKICGISAGSSAETEKDEPSGVLSILSGEGVSAESETSEETPSCYISIDTAKNLLLDSGTIPISTEMRMQITSSGQEASVTKQLENMGFSVANSNPERLEAWERTEENIFNTLFTGIVALLAAIALLKGKLDLDTAVHGKEYKHLQQIFNEMTSQKRNLILRINLTRIIALLILSFLLSAVLFWIIPLLFQNALPSGTP